MTAIELNLFAYISAYAVAWCLFCVVIIASKDKNHWRMTKGIRLGERSEHFSFTKGKK